MVTRPLCYGMEDDEREVTMRKLMNAIATALSANGPRIVDEAIHSPRMWEGESWLDLQIMGEGIVENLADVLVELPTPEVDPGGVIRWREEI